MRVISSNGEPVGIGPVDVHRLLSSLRRGRPAGTGGLRLRAVLLLAGAVRTSTFHSAVDRCLLDLPVTDGMTLLDLWGAHFLSLSEAFPTVRMRVLFDNQSRAPVTAMATLGERFSVERDPLPFRGTGGLLRDVVRHYDPDDYVLVADAAQVLTRPLGELVEQFSACDGDVIVAADPLGRPAGLMLIRSGVLHEVQAMGYVDLKEQALPLLKAAGAVIRVLTLPALPTMAVRGADDYLEVVRAFGTGEFTPAGDAAMARFRLVETGATVDARAKLFDSVVLRGGVVRSGARVIRSIVCGGAVVQSGERVVDRLVLNNSRSRLLALS